MQQARRRNTSQAAPTLFSIELLRPFRPSSIESVALCAKDDELLRPLLEAHPGCRVVVCPPEIVARV